MRLKKAIRIAKENNLKTLKETYIYIETLALEYFEQDKVEDELVQLIKDIEELAFEYNVDFCDICDWTISEVELYV